MMGREWRTEVEGGCIAGDEEEGIYMHINPLLWFLPYGPSNSPGNGDFSSQLNAHCIMYIHVQVILTRSLTTVSVSYIHLHIPDELFLIPLKAVRFS